MALVTVTISTADFSLATAVTPVIITLVSNQPYIDASSVDIQRVITTATNSGGTLSIAIENNAALSDTASTYTFQLGANRYSGVVVPPSGPVTLLSLLPAITVRAVAITFTSWDASDTPEVGIVATAYLSVDCTNLDGVTILAGQPIRSAGADSSGNGTLSLERTDQLTPVTGSGEPYYRITLGSAIYYKKVHAAGTLVGLPTALPTTTNGGISADQTALAADAAVLTGSYPGTAVTLQDELRQLAQWPVTHIAAATYTSLDTDKIIEGDGISNAVAITLRTAVGWKGLLILKATNVTHAVTFTGTGGQTFDGAATLTPALNVAYILYSNGANWRVAATANIGGGGGSLELTDGTHDLTGVSKITTSRMVVGGTAGASTLDPPIATSSVLGVAKFGTGLAVDGAGNVTATGSLTNPMGHEGALIQGGNAGTPVELQIGTAPQTLVPVGPDLAWVWPVAPPGFADPTRATNDLLVRQVATKSSLVVGIIGDSISLASQGVTAAYVAALAALGVTVTLVNQAVSGTSTSDWGIGGTDDTNAVAAFSTADVVLIALGVNDARVAVRNSAATYGAQLAAIARGWVNRGKVVCIQQPTYCIPGSNSGDQDAAANLLRIAYQQQIALLANNFTIWVGDTSGYTRFANTPSLLTDGIHPTPTGNGVLGGLWAAGSLACFSTLLGQTTLVRLPGPTVDGTYLGRESGVFGYFTPAGGGGGGATYASIPLTAAGGSTPTFLTDNTGNTILVALVAVPAPA